jgi:hypothetical protein
MLLKKSHEGKMMEYALERCASLKDIIESQGIPQTEVAQILLKNIGLGFGFIPGGGEVISVFTSTLLRPQPICSLKLAVKVEDRTL